MKVPGGGGGPADGGGPAGQAAAADRPGAAGGGRRGPARAWLFPREGAAHPTGGGCPPGGHPIVRCYLWQITPRQKHNSRGLPTFTGFVFSFIFTSCVPPIGISMMWRTPSSVFNRCYFLDGHIPLHLHCAALQMHSSQLVWADFKRKGSPHQGSNVN